MLLVLVACSGVAAKPTSTGPAPMLEPGPYRVGFRATWTFDAARPYETAFDHGATYRGPRPILVNLWYPAVTSGPPTTRAAYLQPPDGPTVHALARALAAYVRNVTANEAFGDDEAKLSPALRQAFAAYLVRPLTAVRDAAPAAGTFPVLVYHGGAGSSYGENVELCEHLASHGYVVLGSAFFDPSGESLNIGAGWRDFDPLLAWAARLPFADPGRAGGVGHSAGAQQMLFYATYGTGRLRALALLDTTIDVHGIVEPLHTLVPELLARRATITAPLLAFAKPEAIFAFLDQLDGADRTYATVGELDHDEYLGHGVVRATLPDVPAERAPRVHAAYRAVAATLRAFFDRELRGLPAPLPRTAATHLERVARGAHEPPPFTSATLPPSPRQLRAVLAARGPAATVELLRARRAAEPDNPIYVAQGYAASLFYDLVATDQRDAALALFPYFHQLFPELVDELVAWAKMALLFERPATARIYIAAALLVEPGHKKALALAAEHRWLDSSHSASSPDG